MVIAYFCCHLVCHFYRPAKVSASVDATFAVSIHLCIIATESMSVAMQYECKVIEASAGINHKVDELLVGILKQIRLKKRRLLEDHGICEKVDKEKGACATGPRTLLDKIFYKKHRYISKSCTNLHVA